MEKRNDISFISLFLELHLEDYKEGGIKALFPLKLIGCFFVGALVPGLLFYVKDVVLPGDMLVVFSGLIAAQGIILAITLTSSQNILSNIAGNGFSSYLKRNNLLKYYLYFIEYFQIVSVIALLFLILTTFVLACPFSNKTYYFFICISSGMFFYSTKNSVDICVLVKELIYYRSVFESKIDDHSEKENKQVIPFQEKKR